MVPWLFLFVAGAAFAEPRTILVVHSGNPEFYWTRAQMTGIRAALERSPFVLDVEYLDLNRPDSGSYRPVLADLLRKKYAPSRDMLAAIIATDDPALQLVVEDLADIFAGIPLAFSGINEALPEALSEPARWP